LRAYKKGEFTDLTITCGTLIFNVHRLVVCTSCDFFKRSLKFAVGKEAEELHIDLPEDDPEMIRRLISYLYLGDYDPTGGSTIDVLKFLSLYQHESSTDTAATHHSRYRKETSAFQTQDNCACLSPNSKNLTQPMEEVQTATAPSDYKVVAKPDNMVEVENPLTIHAAMYALGDKYQVDGLCNTAKEKFRSCLHHHAHSEDFIAATQAVYSTTPDSNRGLRDVVVSAFRSQFRVDVTQIPGAEEKLDTIDELSFALIKSWPTKTEPTKAPSFVQASSNNAGQGLFGGGAHRSVDTEVVPPPYDQSKSHADIISQRGSEDIDEDDEESNYGFWGENTPCTPKPKRTSTSHFNPLTPRRHKGAWAFCCFWCAISVCILAAFGAFFAADLVFTQFGMGTGMARWMIHGQGRRAEQSYDMWKILLDDLLEFEDDVPMVSGYDVASSVDEKTLLVELDDDLSEEGDVVRQM
ncbi:hypothetical protein FB567DRAFT_436379, partial [Paraphoma chrysanthemicola]